MLRVGNIQTQTNRVASIVVNMELSSFLWPIKVNGDTKEPHTFAQRIRKQVMTKMLYNLVDNLNDPIGLEQGLLGHPRSCSIALSRAILVCSDHMFLWYHSKVV